MERLINIVFSQLNVDKLMLENELERLINSEEHETEQKVLMIKELLNKLSLTEYSIAKFSQIIPKNTNTTNNG